MTRAILMAILLMGSGAQAVEYHAVAHGISYHFGKEFNEINPGAGIRFEYSEDWSLQVGAYRNSIDRNSVYVIADWTPLHVGVFSAGLFGGAASGYEWKSVAGVTGVVGGVARAQVDRWSVALRAAPKHPKSAAVVALEIAYRF